MPVSPTGRSRATPSPSRFGERSTTASTAATSARTSARGTAASRSAAPARRRPEPSRTSRSSTGSRPRMPTSASATSGSSSRATIPATCAGTRSSRWGTAAVRSSASTPSATPARTTTCSASMPNGRSPASTNGRIRSRVSQDANRRSRTEVWMAWVRLLAVPFAVLEVGLLKDDYPPGYERWAWALTALLAVGSGVLLWLAYRVPEKAWRRIGFGALVLDTVVVYGYVLVHVRAGDADPAAGLHPADRGRAPLRDRRRLRDVRRLGLPARIHRMVEGGRFPPQEFDVDRIVLPVGVQLILGLVVGSLVERLRDERRGARAAWPRPRRCATSSVAARTSSTRPTGPRGRSDPPSTRTRRSRRSSGSCED